MSYGYYLVQLTYTAKAWQELADWAYEIATKTKKAPADGDRLGSVETLIKEFGGRIADIDCRGSEGAIRGKLVGCGGDDLVAILWFPDHANALGFKIAVAAEEGVRSILLTPLMPMKEALKVMALVGEKRCTTGYSAPGGESKTWMVPPPPASAKSRAGSKSTR